MELEALDKDKSYFVYCQTGNRSSKATELMHSLGSKHVHDLQGGMTAWQGVGLPSTRNGSGDGRSERVRLSQLCDLSTIRSILRFTIPKRTT